MKLFIKVLAAISVNFIGIYGFNINFQFSSYLLGMFAFSALELVDIYYENKK